MPSSATARSGSASKNEAISLAIFTSLCASIAASLRRSRQEIVLPGAEIAELALPLGGRGDLGELDRGDLVLGAVGRPVRVLGGDDVGAGLGVVERRVDHAGLHPLGQAGAQHGLA